MVGCIQLVMGYKLVGLISLSGQKYSIAQSVRVRSYFTIMH